MAWGTSRAHIWEDLLKEISKSLSKCPLKYSKRLKRLRRLKSWQLSNWSHPIQSLVNQFLVGLPSRHQSARWQLLNQPASQQWINRNKGVRIWKLRSSRQFKAHFEGAVNTGVSQQRIQIYIYRCVLREREREKETDVQLLATNSQPC